MLQLDALIAELRRLQEEVKDLQGQIASWEESHYYREEATAQQGQRCRRRIAELEREEEDARYRGYERETAFRELERARSWHDPWGEEQALDKLKRLS